jgi:glycogen debranching enzyme
MSYHNGSVWPHDNALIAAGLSRYGYQAEAVGVMTAVYEAGRRFPGYRLPELYCGFTRDRHYHSLPAEYPVSCRPQAWAAASVFLLLQQVLGLRAEPAQRRIVLRPRLPPDVGRIALRGLRAVGGCVDLTVEGRDGAVKVDVHGGGTSVLVERGDVAVVV